MLIVKNLNRGFVHTWRNVNKNINKKTIIIQYNNIYISQYFNMYHINK
jgi:hypothetical protein